MKRITFITTGQPTTNPRLIKEAETLHNLGYQVKVICCFYQSWAQKFDQEIIDRNPEMYIYCGGTPLRDKIPYFRSRLRQKICVLLFSYIKRMQIAENAISRTHREALAIAGQIKTDLYIAHNLGALPTAVLAAKKTNARVGYDAEDMHSGQFTSKKDKTYLLNKYIETKYFKHTDYFTAASPLIAAFYHKLYPDLQPVVINNVFRKTSLNLKQNYKTGGCLKLFWFSQTVGPNRGLEQIIKAMAITAHPVQLHLLGKCPAEYKLKILQLLSFHKLHKNQVRFHEPIPADALFNYAISFDIGMASETDVSLNRDICLTNKVFTYIQCGLALIASDTKAQKQFMQQYPGTGKLYDKNSAESLADCINAYAGDPGSLYQNRLKNYHLGQTVLNWETESLKFLKVIANT
ncbi:glycosyltransferase [Pedobacter heparinus]|uniref:Glycosyl transferase group 1 n=1 Tax=Pedobacter heparinus (strain ATCC 13125 / DSM 2366 / CIP 104194 / JCM 7457 / NBRC 12017 / NCIMB 9290 / NRRL B-14731 / HIM 762-3) TaxID=485917 RepID=C6XVL9_PEDHD|nr:glycosyltransferase [Pedobacter heparinus]ACU06094.1 hypothetical protein Phep_3903 [Pedobacter heparinus DSM 2366]